MGTLELVVEWRVAVRRQPGHPGSPEGWAAEQRVGSRTETTQRLPRWEGGLPLPDGGGAWGPWRLVRWAESERPW